MVSLYIKLVILAGLVTGLAACGKGVQQPVHYICDVPYLETESGALFSKGDVYPGTFAATIDDADGMVRLTDGGFSTEDGCQFGVKDGVPYR